ncbi:MAG: GTP-binding protein [Actinomycetia bacterium]|nr:GTP-binding protein [Actinomycetes bacterium]MCP5032750.1 GTP-binding protein [Actinomycetes bacterium]
MSDDLIERSRALLDRAEVVFAAAPGVLDLATTRARLDEPLRVAIAGKVKAGKSTLLNALVGDRLAPTDTGECTRIVTWYQDGHTYQVMLYPRDGSAPTQARFQRDDGAIDVDIGGRDPITVDRLEITCPSSSLRQITLIDTPGVDTLNEEIGERAYDFLDPKDTETPADAVLYLMKHIHTSDLRLLEAFHDEAVSQPNPINAIAVLSRADEIGGGRIDAMGSARRIAARYGRDARLRRLVQVVLPMAGLLAETARTLTEREFRQLVELATVPRRTLEDYLLSADRFINADPEIPLTSMERSDLLGRLGIFGIRQSMALLRSKNVNSSVELADELTARSGLNDLQTILTTLFVDRAAVLKSRSALLAVERLCEENTHNPASADLLLEIEEIMAGAHPFNELATLAAMRTRGMKGREDDLLDLERTLGSAGTTPWQRLGLRENTAPEDMLSAAYEAIGRWQRLAESPLTNHNLSQAARVAIRSLEEIVAKLSAPAP